MLDINLTASAMEWLSTDEIDSAPTLPLISISCMDAVKNDDKSITRMLMCSALMLFGILVLYCDTKPNSY